MSGAFTPLDPNVPRADQFRLGDVWQALNGRRYLVRRGLGEKLVALHAIGGGPPLHLRRDSVERFRRLKWGGQP